MVFFRQGEKRGERGQLTIEYALMFTVVVAVVLYATRNVMGPALNSLYNDSGNMMTDAAGKMSQQFKISSPISGASSGQSGGAPADPGPRF